MFGFVSNAKRPSSRLSSPDGGEVLDRLSARFRKPIHGGMRIDLAQELDRALPRVAACGSKTVASLQAHKEAVRIVRLLGISATGGFCEVLAEELTSAAHPSVR